MTSIFCPPIYGSLLLVFQNIFPQLTSHYAFRFFVFLSVPLFFRCSIVLEWSHWVFLESATWAQAYYSHMTFVYSPTLLIALACTEWGRGGGVGTGCVGVMEQSEKQKWTGDPGSPCSLMFLVVCSSVTFIDFVCMCVSIGLKQKTEIKHMLKFTIFFSVFGSPVRTTTSERLCMLQLIWETLRL